MMNDFSLAFSDHFPESQRFTFRIFLVFQLPNAFIRWLFRVYTLLVFSSDSKQLDFFPIVFKSILSGGLSCSVPPYTV